MAVSKLTMFFELRTELTTKAIGGRTAGWTESWYYPGEVSAAIGAATGRTGICTLRANMLPRSAAITAQRYQIVDTVPAGAATSRFTNFPGGGFETDIPQMAILVNVPGQGVRNRKKLILRGIPDNQVVDGEFIGDAVYGPIVQKFLNTLGNWRFRGQDFNAQAKPINFIAANGDVTMVDNVTFASGQKISISGVTDPVTGKKVKTATWMVLNPAGKVFSARGWRQTNEFAGGEARLISPTYLQPDVANIEVERAITRKVGRPFDQYVGRRRQG